VKLKVLPRAARDLQSIRSFIEKDDEAAAKQVIAKLVHSIDLIVLRPEIGRPAKGRDTREWTVPGLPYIIPYQVKADELIILRIYHTRRKRPNDWQ
jgi:addiction module RelE/StbE family toxin